MNLDEYKAGALLTESKINEVLVDKSRLEAIVKIFVAAGNILDQYKKNIYYEKNFDNHEYSNCLSIIDTYASCLTSDRDYTDFNKVSNTDKLNIDPRLLHGIFGIATEATELLEAIQHFDGIYDSYNIAEELGDCSWYTAILTDTLNLNWTSDILEVNYKKLEKRYGKSFSDDAAINRNLDKEREILEDISINDKNLDGC